MLNHYQNKKLSQTKLPWHDVCILAEAEGEQFQDVDIITTRADYSERLFNELMNRVHYKLIPRPRTERKIVQRMFEIHDENKTFTCEHVEINNSGRIKVVVNASIIDDEAILKGMGYIAKTLELRADGYKWMQYSSWFQYDAHELFWLFKH